MDRDGAAQIISTKVVLWITNSKFFITFIVAQQPPEHPGKPGLEYLTEGQKQMLQRVLYRANHRGFTSHCHDLDTLAESSQHSLFRHSRHSAHCLNHLYTIKLKPPGAMRLRPCGHDFELPTVKFEFNKRNFIVRSISIRIIVYIQI